MRGLHLSDNTISLSLSIGEQDIELMKADPHGNIIITHINVRQSISILLAKIVVLDLIAAACISVFFTVLCQFKPNYSFFDKLLTYNTFFFVFLGASKIYYTVYVTLLWLNEYYEVMPSEILHKRGLFWRKEQLYALKYVRTLKLTQGFLGRIFNYGTISLFDIRKNKFFDLYLIHDPHRYLHILEKILGNPHEEKRVFKAHFFGEEMEMEDKDYQQLEKP